MVTYAIQNNIFVPVYAAVDVCIETGIIISTGICEGEHTGRTACLISRVKSSLMAHSLSSQC